MLIRKHKSRVSEIMETNMEFGVGWLSLNKPKPGELNTEEKLKQTLKYHHQVNKFKYDELNKQVKGRNFALLRKLAEISNGRTGSLVDRNAPRMGYKRNSVVIPRR